MTLLKTLAIGTPLVIGTTYAFQLSRFLLTYPSDATVLAGFLLLLCIFLTWANMATYLLKQMRDKQIRKAKENVKDSDVSST